MGQKRRIRAYKAPRLSNKLKKRNTGRRSIKEKNSESEIWSKEMSTNANYSNIKVVAYPNRHRDTLAEKPDLKEPAELRAYNDLKQLKERRKILGKVKAQNPLQQILYDDSLEMAESTNKKYQWYKITRDEALIVQSLVKKYSEDDFEAMRRDIKLNKMQWTEKQCQMKINEYRLRYGLDFKKELEF